MLSILIYSAFVQTKFYFQKFTKKQSPYTLFRVFPFYSFNKTRAKIWTDDVFKKDIKRIRKNAKQETLKALIPFHHREIYRFKVEIRKSKRARFL